MDMLPEIFHMDNYTSCMENDNLYCQIRARITLYENNTIKEYVQNLVEDMDLLDRRILYRSLCISKPSEINESYIKTTSENIINERLKDHQLKSNVEYISCTNGHINPTLYDYTVLGILIIYIFFVMFATYYERLHRLTQKKTAFQKIVSEFSISYNWAKKTNLTKNEDFKNLLNMQGFRCFTMLTIIMFHALTVYSVVYIANPIEFEKMLSLPSAQYIQIINMHLVLNFFVLSSWLLTIQIDSIVKKHGEFSLKHAGIIILNRYFRLMVIYGFVILLLTTSWVHIFSGPLNFQVVEQTREKCQNNFVFSIFLVQNMLNVFDSCNPISWYIAVDFQVYVLNIIVLYVWYRCKFNPKKFFAAIFVLSSLVYGCILYHYNSKGIYLLRCRNLQMISLNKSLPILYITYTSAWSTFPASFIGTIFGIIYIENKNKTIKSNRLISILWGLFLFGVPHLVFLINTQDFQRIPAAIIGSMTKPLYCLGISIGIFGMSHNIGGRIKKYYENKYIVVMGNFTYCIYICHWILMLGRHTESPPFIDGPTVLTDAVSLLLKAVIVGVIASIIIEEPGLSMQKRILPQTTKKEDKTKTK